MKRYQHAYPRTAAAGAGAGGAILLTVPGPLGVGSDLAPMVCLDRNARATGARADVKQAPTGAALTALAKVAGADWLELTIAAGETSAVATAEQIAEAEEIGAGENVRLDLTGVGSTFPGADLSFMIFL